MVAAIFGMDAEVVGGIFQMTNSRTMTVEAFVHMMPALAQQNPNMTEAEQAAGFDKMQRMIELSKSTEVLAPVQLAGAFQAMISEDMIDVTQGTVLCAEKIKHRGRRCVSMLNT